MEQPSPSSEPPPVPSPPETTSLVARMMNVLAAPGQVFDEIKASPACTANWLVPAALFAVVSWIGVVLVFSQPAIEQQLTDISTKAIDKQLAKGGIPKENAEQMREVAEKWGSIGAKISAYVAPPFGAVISTFGWGLVLWLVGVKVLKGNFEFMKAVEVTGIATMIGVLAAVVKTLLVLSLGNLFASPSLALLVKDFDPQIPTHNLLAVFDIMSFWSLGVLSLGLSRLSGASVLKSGAWLFGIWGSLMAVMTGFGFAMQALAAR